MIALPRTIRVWAYGRPTDLRKGYNGLVGLVKQQLRLDRSPGLPTDRRVEYATTLPTRPRVTSLARQLALDRPPREHSPGPRAP